MSTTVFAEKRPCTACGRFLGAAGIDLDREPQPGDYTVCGYCLTAHVFGEGMTLVHVAEEDLPEEMRDEIARIRGLARQWLGRNLA